MGQLLAMQQEKKKSSYHHKNLREALLDRADELIVERHGAEFSLRELAKELGVTHAAVYRHFSDKNALIDAVCARGYEVFASYQAEALRKSEDDPMARLIALGVGYFNFVREHQGFWSVMFTWREAEDRSLSGRDEFEKLTFERVVEAVADCQNAGLILATDPAPLVRFLMLAPQGYASMALNSDPRAFEGPNSVSFPEPEAVLRTTLYPFLVHKPSTEELLGGLGKKQT